MQVHTCAEHDLSYLPYDQKQGDEDVLTAYYHDIGEIEKKGSWLRFEYASYQWLLVKSLLLNQTQYNDMFKSRI